MYINGQWVSADEKIEIVNPATGDIFATVPKGGAYEAKQSVDAAYKAFKTWSKKTAGERSELLMKWHRLIEENKEEIGRIMTEEQG
ncbi:aldehyde dehydrogenase family protein, partial [Domibacillus tundrae]